MRPPGSGKSSGSELINGLLENHQLLGLGLLTSNL